MSLISLGLRPRSFFWRRKDVQVQQDEIRLRLAYCGIGLFLKAVRKASFSVTAVFAGPGCDSLVGQKLARQFSLPFRGVPVDCQKEEDVCEYLQGVLTRRKIEAVVALWDGTNLEVHNILIRAQTDGLQVQIARVEPWLS
ncbi:hypothetical protein [Desulfovibrio sp. Huiquan2017]|uniref:hypothetical protein n=1 Tax=Desulfovibrio sp. Huiquan2017 TaxID=2816861 RepID=UPI001A91E1F2|nr:hypothetical protein [Desulfovibrio sp. Huiquan2017]